MSVILITIPMGIETSDIPTIKPKKFHNTIICITNFNLAYWKGIDLLLHVTKKLPNIKLILIGKGTKRKELISLAKKLKIENRVSFTGYISRKKLWLYLLKANLFVLPTRSSFHEGTNRAILEAMMCELPIVVTRTGGLPELVVDNINGFVVEPENVDELANAILMILNNPGLGTKIGRNNKLKAKEYSVNTLTAKRIEYLSKFS